ncbi:MAG: hypothetical protein HY363_03985 [Candidatus Aenigmarchaeota archaeon]|nr:hypothetical protein [Candidatus Aenigmarchaeota archaeon]
MQEYEARYTTFAGIFDGGCIMPDPEPHKDMYRFKAKSEAEARTIAQQYVVEVAGKYFGVEKVSLDELVQVKSVKLK